MPELGSYGSVRGAAGNSRPYRERRRQRPLHTRHSRRRQLAKGRNRGRWGAEGAAGACTLQIAWRINKSRQQRGER